MICDYSQRLRLTDDHYSGISTDLIAIKEGLRPLSDENGCCRQAGQRSFLLRPVSERSDFACQGLVHFSRFDRSSAQIQPVIRGGAEPTSPSFRPAKVELLAQDASDLAQQWSRREEDEGQVPSRDSSVTSPGPVGHPPSPYRVGRSDRLSCPWPSLRTEMRWHCGGRSIPWRGPMEPTRGPSPPQWAESSWHHRGPLREQGSPPARASLPAAKGPGTCRCLACQVPEPYHCHHPPDQWQILGG